MTNLTPRQREVLEKMRDGATLEFGYQGILFLRVNNGIYSLPHLTIIKNLKKHKLIEFQDPGCYELTTKGREALSGRQGEE